MTGNIAILERNDALLKSKRFRSELPGDPSKLFQLESGAIKRVYNGNLASGATTLYTCPIWKRAISQPGLYMVHNPTAGAIALDFHHVPSGGSVNANNRMANLTIAVDETRTILGSTTWHTIGAGSSLVINPGGAGLNAWAIFQEIREEAATFIGGFVGDLPAAVTTLITCPALRTLVLSNIIVHNHTAGGSAFFAWLREAGVAAADANEIVGVTAGIGANAEAEFNRFDMAAVGQGGLVSAQAGSPTIHNVWANAILL